MDFQRLCYACFREKNGPLCPYCGFSPANEGRATLALPLGSILNGRYLAGKVLGIGGFGITYLGFDLTLELKVAIKEYLPSGMASRQADRYTLCANSAKDEEAYQNGAERFLDEARILAKLQNTPNIVSVQNYFKENNSAYFVMEYVDGLSLKQFLIQQGGRIPYQQALHILLPVMAALSEVHAQKLLHRDISPDNINITSGGKSMLLDFGAARFSPGDEKSISVILKHGFAPEEQYRSHGNQGPWTDVYAMGATLYNCISGVLPPDAIDRLHEDRLLPPSALGLALPIPIEMAIMRALALRAQDRFANMTAMIRALTHPTISGQPLTQANMALSQPASYASATNPSPIAATAPGFPKQTLGLQNQAESPALVYPPDRGAAPIQGRRAQKAAMPKALRLGLSILTIVVGLLFIISGIAKIVAAAKGSPTTQGSGTSDNSSTLESSSLTEAPTQKTSSKPSSSTVTADGGLQPGPNQGVGSIPDKHLQFLYDKSDPHTALVGFDGSPFSYGTLYVDTVRRDGVLIVDVTSASYPSPTACMDYYIQEWPKILGQPKNIRADANQTYGNNQYLKREFDYVDTVERKDNKAFHCILACINIDGDSIVVIAIYSAEGKEKILANFELMAASLVRTK